MDINHVELKGRVANDVTYRKTKDGNDWAAFHLVVNEYNPKAKVEKDKSIPTWISIAVFNSTLVNKVKNLKLRQGETVWLNGKVFVNTVEKGGYTHPYTSIIASELEVIKKKKSTNKEVEMKPPTSDDQPF